MAFELPSILHRPIYGVLSSEQRTLDKSHEFGSAFVGKSQLRIFCTYAKQAPDFRLVGLYGKRRYAAFRVTMIG
ncbi:hypothetical protein [Methylotuvimicrobium alcaliphilum]|uniref:hypothetical protein n=1 Tax=Methylotuvimicrobium alcaliphilum TaxID=271065 RepID=UPI0013A07DAC|nr:hypothetical protein [Methylotuvimicrobium alcaliphilum]